MPDADKPGRRRLTPEARKAELLDAAIRLILKDGISRLTMQKIANEAGASKSLLYAYFENVQAILSQVYLREHQKLRDQQLDALKEPHGFEDMVKLTWRISRDSESELRLLVSRLAADASLKASMSDVDHRVQEGVVNYVSGEISQQYRMPETVARAAVRLALGYELTPEAGEHGDEIWGAMIVGAMKELEQRYGEQE